MIRYGLFAGWNFRILLKITCATRLITLNSPFSMIDGHCPGTKQEVGKRNSNLFLPPLLLLVMCFANWTRHSFQVPPKLNVLKITKSRVRGLIEDLRYIVMEIQPVWFLKVSFNYGKKAVWYTHLDVWKLAFQCWTKPGYSHTFLDIFQPFCYILKFCIFVQVIVFFKRNLRHYLPMFESPSFSIIPTRWSKRELSGISNRINWFWNIVIQQLFTHNYRAVKRRGGFHQFHRHWSE